MSTIVTQSSPSYSGYVDIIREGGGWNSGCTYMHVILTHLSEEKSDTEIN